MHVPILRAGRPYRSLDRVRLPDVATGEVIAEVSQANRGLIARDLLGLPEAARALRSRPAAGLIDACRRAAALFMEADLPVDGTPQGPEEYIRTQSATTGMPRALCRANMEKNRFVMAEMSRVLAGWTRGLDPAALDTGWGMEGGRIVSFRAQTDALGAVLPNNSPGVHSLWIPAIAMKVPLVLRPGRQEPWTPHRVLQALIGAGVPPEALFFYPSDHAGAAEVLLRCGRSMLFGDDATLAPWREDPRVQLHGPGWSKVILDEEAASEWERHLDLMAISIAENGGRSCLNASGVWTMARGAEIAEGLAARMASIRALPLDDPEARLAAFPDPGAARRVSGMIDRLLLVPGAEDVTARIRPGGRVAEAGGCTFLLPTVVRCDDPEHPLARTELLFPFAAVVEVPRGEMTRRIGSTLVATAPHADAAFRAELMACPAIDRLNLGSIPTSRVSWDQPHEGNLFEHLYRQRSFQEAGRAGAAAPAGA